MTVASDVDHIVPVAAFFALGMDAVSNAFWDAAGNWQPLCHSHHSQKTATENGGFGRVP